MFLARAARGDAFGGLRSIRSEHGTTLSVYPGPGTAAGTAGPHTVVRVSRVQLIDSAGTHEGWYRQTHLLIRGADGAWRFAAGQRTLLYYGPRLDPALHARYAGTYVIRPGRVLLLEWEDGALLATHPNDIRSEVFLASPTDEVLRTVGNTHLRFTLGPDGTPVAAALVRGGQEVWRAPRRTP